MVTKVLLSWLRALDELIFPPNPPCPLCGKDLALAVGCCQTCLDVLAIDWQMNAVNGFTYFSLFPYQNQARELVHRMKFLGGYDQALLFGFLLALAVREEVRLVDLDLLIPIPLHPTRLSERGFNQAAVLADRISEVCRLPVAQLLVRNRATPPQSGLTLAERQRNMQNAFSLLPSDLKGKTCLIVDDVITSGHTFSAAAHLVVQAGGKPIGGFLARTEIWEE